MPSLYWIQPNTLETTVVKVDSSTQDPRLGSANVFLISFKKSISALLQAEKRDLPLIFWTSPLSLVLALTSSS